MGCRICGTRPSCRAKLRRLVQTISGECVPPSRECWDGLRRTRVFALHPSKSSKDRDGARGRELVHPCSREAREVQEVIVVVGYIAGASNLLTGSVSRPRTL